jgi:hypothetical protein
MFPILDTKVVVTLRLYELLGLIFGAEHDHYIYCM